MERLQYAKKFEVQGFQPLEPGYNPVQQTVDCGPLKA
jgi:hypothetical protein